MAAKGGVMAVAEGRPGPISDATIDAMAEAARLAGQLGAEADAVLLGHCDDELVGALGSQGATRVFAVAAVDASLHDADTYVPLLVDLIGKRGPVVVLYAAAALGREVAARVAARLNTGLASDCTELSVGPDRVLHMSRAVYGGRASCTVVCPRARPQMATLQSRPSAARPSTPGRVPRVIQVETSRAAAPRTKVEGLIQGDPSTMELAEADVIVAGGRGVGSREGFELLVDLASLLGGAVAASRVAVDAGWVPSHRQVGQSGRTVAPGLYVACGISGAPHHTVGMRDAGTVIAINTDSTAPIFDLADMGLVGDVHDVLPPVLARLRETKSKGSSPDATAFSVLAQSLEDGE